MERSPDERERLEAELREQLRAAEKSYRKARMEHNELKAIYGYVFDSPDALLSVQQSLMRELEALEAYKNALKRFSDFVLGSG